MRRIVLMVFASVLVFSIGAAAQNLSVSLAPSTPAGAAADPPAYKGGNDYPLRIALNYQFSGILMNRSDVSNFHNNGINTEITGYLGHSFALEGEISAGFGSTTFHNTNGQNSTINADTIFYGGGIRVGPEHGRFQPWGHALVGGERFQFTQTSAAIGHDNGFAFQAGLGADIRIGPRAFWTVEGDYLGTRMISSYQTNYLFDTGLAFSF